MQNLITKQLEIKKDVILNNKSSPGGVIAKSKRKKPLLLNNAIKTKMANQTKKSLIRIGSTSNTEKSNKKNNSARNSEENISINSKLTKKGILESIL
tara:strand:- start:327 stop:617 length:291 start_codon:yes stop_codon:yes gene_type:complete